ncbi:PP2C family protein-serine/threonine phosphatase [Paenibacillus humicola]|uniref:PP2C family protein-serine/threonine phosphatase n=1 Tax=Paenibacillus humicola TaxID=3110540 RepID=UPI00237BC15D|nr:fused response regulator/phosphatase [Paenibacillus humicola]
MSIVIVDDNPMNITVVQEILKRAGYKKMSPASSGSELFRLLGLTPFGDEPEKPDLSRPDVDLILMDMMMPGIDGISACRAIQRSERLRDIPIIMVTAIGDSNKLAESLDAGAIDYVTKPINRIELLARIRVALRLKEQMDLHKDRDRRVKEELQLAREVQLAALPQPVEEEGISIQAIFRPSEELSGDLYAWNRIDDHRYGVAVIDAMGHGISSSLVCMFIASVLKDAMVKIVEPRRLIRELNRRALQLHFADQLIQYYFTALYMVVDLKNGTVEYVNAGHPPGMLLRGDGSVESFAGGGVAIGMFEEVTVEKHALQLASGDRLILFTDGMLELAAPAGEDQVAKLQEALRTLSGMSCEQVEERLFKDDSESRPDDRCIVLVDIR